MPDQSITDPTENTTSGVASNPEAQAVSVRASRFQSLGYIRVHRAIIEDCGHGAALVYGVLEDLAQIAARHGNIVFPSHDYLCQEATRSAAQLKRDLVSLRDQGWLTWKRTGRSSEYYLKDHSELSRSSKRAIADTDTSKEQEVTSNARTRESAKEPTTMPEEMKHSYWQHSEFGADRVLAFTHLWQNWPRKNHSRLLAAQSWRKHVVGMFDGFDPKLPTDEQREFVDALNRWLREWKERGDETLVPHLSTWLNQERWRS